MLLLTSTSDIIRVVTGASVSTITVHVSYVDNASGVITPLRTNTLITTAATTTVVPSPSAGVQRNVKQISITNNNATTSCQVTVQHFDGTNSTDLMGVIVAAGENLVLDDNGVWHHHNPQGAEYTATATPPLLFNNSSATVSAGYATDTLLAGSSILLPSGITVAGVQYEVVFDMVKTAAGVATPIINLRFGTAGTVADASICTMTFAAGTAAADTGKFTVVGTLRSAGAGTSAVMVGSTMVNHALAATGLTTTGASGTGQITTVGGGFNSTTTNSYLSVSFNGGASFSGTNNFVQARLYNFRG
jgi:hypothetical protein